MGNAFGDYLAAHGGVPGGGSNAFTDYLKRGGTVGKFLPHAKAIPTPQLGTSKPAAAPHQDFMSWALDILQRPERAVENTLQGVADIGIDAQAAIMGKKAPDNQSIGDAVGETLSGIPRGLFSTAKSDQPLASDLIEKNADKIGKLYDPNYKDVQDNVNPIVKGIAGFAGDVAMDPLTYIPGLDVIKAGRIGLEAFKGGEDALKGTEALKGIGRALAPGGEDLAAKIPGLAPSEEGQKVLDLRATVDAAGRAAKADAREKGLGKAATKTAVLDAKEQARTATDHVLDPTLDAAPAKVDPLDALKLGEPAPKLVPDLSERVQSAPNVDRMRSVIAHLLEHDKGEPAASAEMASPPVESAVEAAPHPLQKVIDSHLAAVERLRPQAEAARAKAEALKGKKGVNEAREASRKLDAEIQMHSVDAAALQVKIRHEAEKAHIQATGVLPGMEPKAPAQPLHPAVAQSQQIVDAAAQKAADAEAKAVALEGKKGVTAARAAAAEAKSEAQKLATMHAQIIDKFGEHGEKVAPPVERPFLIKEDWVKHILDNADNPDMPMVAIKGRGEAKARPVPLHKVLTNKGLMAREDVRAKVDGLYKDYADEGGAIDPFFNEVVDPVKDSVDTIAVSKAPVPSAVQTPEDAARVLNPEAAAKSMNSRDRFHAMLKDLSDGGGQEQLLDAFGEQLINSFKKITNPKRFNEALQGVFDRLTGALDLDKLPLQAVGRPERDMFSALDIQNPAEVMVAAREARQGIESQLATAKPGYADTVEMLRASRKGHSNSTMVLGEQEAAEEGAALTVDKVFTPEFKGERTATFDKATNRKTARTADKLGAGKGVQPGVANEGFISRAWQSMSEFATRWVDENHQQSDLRLFHGKKVKKAPLNAKTADMKARITIQGLHYLESIFDQAGIPQTLRWVDETTGKELTASLSFTDVADLLRSSEPGRAVLNILLFNPSTGGSATHLLKGIARLVNDQDINDVVSTIASTDTKVWNSSKNAFVERTGGAKVQNWLGGDKEAVVDFSSGYTTRGATPELQPWETKLRYQAAKEGKDKFSDGHFHLTTPAQVRMVLGQVLESLREPLKQLSTDNAAAYAEKGFADLSHLTNEQLARVAESIDSTNMAEAILAVSRGPEYLAKRAEAAGVNPEVAGAARELSDAGLPDGVAEQAAAAEKIEQAHHEGNAGEAILDAGDGAAAQGAKDDAEVADAVNAGEAPPETLNDDETVESANERDAVTSEINHRIEARVNPMKRAFIQSAGLLGKMNLWGTMHNAGALHKVLDTELRRTLNQLNKQFGPGVGLVDGKNTALQLGFEAWKRDSAGEPNQLIEAARQAVDRALSGVLSTKSERAILGSGLISSVPHFEFLNRLMKSGQFPELKRFEFDLPEAERIKRDSKGKVSIAEAAAAQVKSWEIEDPLQFIADLHRATVTAATYAGAAGSVRRMGKESGLLLPKPAEGLVPLALEKNSVLGPFLGTMYVHPEVAFNIRQLDARMQESTRLTSGFGKFIENELDPIQQAWKRAVTVLHPGHHVRNFIGDASMTWAIEGLRHARRAYVDAFRVMHIAGVSDVDAVSALAHLGETARDGGAVASSGKFGDFSYDDIFRGIWNHGVLPSAKVIEDIGLAEGKTNLGARVMNKITFNGEDSKVGHVVHTITEKRDHYQRVQHFLQALYKAQEKGYVDMGWKGFVTPKDGADLFNLITEKVLKAHPDASLLTNIEYKYLRRIIPFYSWMRGALPFMVTTTLRYPGRTTVLSKASYSLATAMGVHPDSLSDPFPTDAQFPSFLQDAVQGPQFRAIGTGDYLSISPGFTQWDIPNTFAENPVHAVLGMMNPFARVPLEMSVGTNFSTGGKIKDGSDYLDSQIPQIGYLANMSGISPTGSLLSIPENQGFDAQYNVANGDKSGAFAQMLGATNPAVSTKTAQKAHDGFADQGTALLNYLLSAQLQDYSKPAYQTLAQLEEKARIKNQGKPPVLNF